MKAPTVRYPFFWLIGLLAVGWIIRLSWPLTEPLRAAAESNWRRMVDGPPFPASSEPKRIAGSFVERGLLLSEPTPVTDVPEGRTTESIRRRIFVDVYDVWPVQPADQPAFYRVGNERPLGWVRADQLLVWPTRLAIRWPSTAGSSDTTTLSAPVGATSGVVGPLPILNWNADAMEVGLWEVNQAWRSLASTSWISSTSVPVSARGILLSRVELLELLRRSTEADSPEARESLRLRAIFGQIFGPRRAEHPSDVEVIRKYLPAWTSSGTHARELSEELSSYASDWRSDVDLSGVGYRLVPLNLLP